MFKQAINISGMRFNTTNISGKLTVPEKTFKDAFFKKPNDIRSNSCSEINETKM